jgi:class 3 adenylate cyclase
VAELPGGIVTFLFTDVEGSTQHQRRLRERWADAHAAQRRLLREAVAESGGNEVDAQGDSFFAVFTGARSAVGAAAAAQRSLHEEAWPDEGDIRLRMGIHTGEPIVGEEGYLGLAVVRAARICAVARGGQVLVSEATRAVVRDATPDGLSLLDVGEHLLKDFDEPERLFEVVIAGLTRGEPLAQAAEPGQETVGASRGSELAVRALALAGQLEGLGPAIEREVGDLLLRAGIDKAVPVESKPAKRLKPKPAKRLKR